jgi:acyl-CoA reductase-like NAD-dependent aldehyde dehydrogenase
MKLRILLHYCFLFLLIIPTVVSSLHVHVPSSQSLTMYSPTDTDTDTTATVDAVVEIVSSKAKEWAELPIERKIKLLEQLLENAREYKDEWVSCQEKKLGIDPNNPLHGYGHFDVTAKGPATFGGYANGILTSLKHSKKHGTPPKPTSTRRVGDKTIATVWPSRFSVLESLEAFGMTAEMVCHGGGDGDEPLQQTQEEAIQEHYRNNRCAAILGPGNFDAPTDLLCELFIKGRVCVYKPNPINEASVDVLKKIMEPVIALGYVAFVPETIPAAKALVQHDQVQEIVLTGSQATLDKIKWGNTLEEQERNKGKNTPINQTPVCAELGAVTPWIIVPGPQWTKRSVDKHARALAFAKMANNGHICVAPQVVVLPKDWKHRAYFWERTRYWLSQHPGSVPYYPGSAESHKHFQQHPNAELIEAAQEESKAVFPGQQRPILISNTSIENDHDQELFQREAWCPVLMELPIDAAKSDTDPMAYLKHAIQVSQSNLYGSLSIAILINDKTIRRSKGEFDDILANHLQYGLVGINIWPCYGNNISQLRWGAFSGNSASGTGSLGNANLYRHTEKTILRAPFLHLPRRTMEVMKPRKVSLLFSRFTTYKLKPTLWTQLGLFAALFLGV